MTTTTIQVSTETAQYLKRMKEQLNVSTYDEVIRQTTSRRAAAKRLGGILKGYFTAKEIEEIHRDLREK